MADNLLIFLQTPTVILNGIFAQNNDNFTVITTSGWSIVDYAIVQASCFDRLDGFEVATVLNMIEDFQNKYSFLYMQEMRMLIYLGILIAAIVQLFLQEAQYEVKEEKGEEEDEDEEEVEEVEEEEEENEDEGYRSDDTDEGYYSE